MYIILGASGQVGSAIVANLLKQGKAVKAIVRDGKKAADLKKLGAEVAVADATDADELSAALKGGDTLFVLTPENEKSKDVLGETKIILANYRTTAEKAGINKIVGLSSEGAQLKEGAGNLEMSYMLEHAFTDLNVTQIFVRPAYYFSNWLPYLDAIKKDGVLPTFYPVDMELPMVAPKDVAELVSELLTSNVEAGSIYQLDGPKAYSSADVAEAFAAVLNKPVKAVQTPRDKWADALKQAGFSPDGIKNFIEMTDAVISGKTQLGGNADIQLTAETTLQEFIYQAVK